MSAPLDDVLVADFSRVLAGPYATQTLGDLGADVIKVERPGAGDDTRGWGPPFAGERSTYHLAVNRNKRSVALDLADDEQRRDAVELAVRADVVIHNFRAGGAERLGLGYGSLRRANPGLVYCAISAFGPGDREGLPGYDFLVQAMGGLMSITGDPQGEPTKVGVALVDVITGMNAAIGILAALRARELDGRGRRVEVDLLSSALAATVNQASGYLNAGAVPGRLGNQHPSVAPYATFETADETIAVAVGSDAQFARLCSVLGRPGLVRDDHFATNQARVQHRAELTAHLDVAFAERGRDEWVARLREVDVPCGPVNDLAEAIALAEAVGAEPVVGLEHPDGSVSRSLASPVRLDGEAVTYRRPPPDLDEHGDDIRAWLRRPR